MTEQTSAAPSEVPVPQVLPAQDVLFVVTPELTEREIRRQKRQRYDREKHQRYLAEGRERPKKEWKPSVGVVDSIPVVRWADRLIARETGRLGYEVGSRASKAQKVVCECLGIQERSLFRWRMEGAKIQLDLLDKMLARSEYLWWDLYSPVAAALVFATAPVELKRPASKVFASHLRVWQHFACTCDPLDQKDDPDARFEEHYCDVHEHVMVRVHEDEEAA